MPRRPRRATSQFVFHVINRAVEGVILFTGPDEYCCFLGILAEGLRRFPVRLHAYALMPTHWHLVLWPCNDESLSALMKWVTATHAQAWRRMRGNVGRGAVYQGRYKAIAVQDDGHFLRMCHYVERNALRKYLVERAEQWPWSSAFPRATEANRPALSSWPVPRPPTWLERLNESESVRRLNLVRTAVRAGRHFGTPGWRRCIASGLEWRQPRQRPRRAPKEVTATRPVTPERADRPESLSRPLAAGHQPSNSLQESEQSRPLQGNGWSRPP